MAAKDTVMKAGDLCIKVCQDHRSASLEAKDCTGLDCEECQLKAQAEITWDKAVREVVELAEEIFVHTFEKSALGRRVQLQQWEQNKKIEWRIK